MKKIRLYGAVIIAMIFWAISFIWTRIAIRSFDPATLISLRLLIASVLLFVFSILWRKFKRPQRKDFKWFVLLAFFEPFLYFIGETYGLTMVDATIASVIVSTIPLFAPVFAFFILKEKLGLTNIIGIFFSLSGVFLLIYMPGNGFSANPSGVALLFMAVISAISYSMVLRKLSSHYSSIIIVLYQSIIGLAFFFPVFLFVDLPHIGKKVITIQAVEAVIMLAVFASVIAFVFFAGAVREIGVSKTNVFVNLIPVITAMVSWMFMNDQMSLIQWLGIVVVIVGLFVSQSGKLRLKILHGPEF